MPNFEVMDGNRFEGDFSLQPVAGYQPNAAEQGYLDQLARVTQALNIDRERDPTGTDQAARKLAEARQNRRQAAIEELRAQADEFCADGLPAASAANHAMIIESRYIGRADFEITDRDRFEDDFDVRVIGSVHPTASERSYINTLRRVTQALAIDKANEPSEPDKSAALAEALSKGRQKAADDLRKQADQFCAGKLAADIAADNALVIKGKYVANRDRLAASLFIVREKFESDGTRKRAIDLLIGVASDLPAPNNVATPEKQALFVELNSALTVIKTVCQRMRERGGGWFARKFRPLRIEAERLRSERLLDQYVRKLAGIGRIGLQGSHTPLAKLALEELRREFVAEEAGRIKNSYVRSLGLACAAAALLLLGVYVEIETRNITAQFWSAHRAFLLAAAGAAIGTWLSFSIRRVTLPFQDLAVLEEDMLDPSVRVMFVIGLTMMACLLFWTGAMNIEIGALKTMQLGGTSGSIAFLVGVFCGLSERALATAISGRAASFVKSVAGS